MLRKLLNFHEALTEKRLQYLCDRQGCRVFPKVRVADVFQIDGSGIANDLYSFALRSHFDFTITGPEWTPLLAVEFDGPLHGDSAQAHRDQLKDQLCSHFSFPLVRINARYLTASFRRLDLLTWVIERWFFERDVAEAQTRGELPADEYFDPALVIQIPGQPNKFPLWLSAEPLLKILRLHQSGHCLDSTPSYFIGCDDAGTYRALAFLLIDQQHGVVVKTAARSQLVPFLQMDLLHEIFPYEIVAALEDVLSQKAEPRSIVDIDNSAQVFQSAYTVLASGRTNRGERPVTT